MKDTRHGIHARKISTGQSEAGGLLVLVQPRLHSEFQAHLGYTVRPGLKKRKKKRERK
jgi:hypothetical protein